MAFFIRGIILFVNHVFKLRKKMIYKILCSKGIKGQIKLTFT